MTQKNTAPASGFLQGLYRGFMNEGGKGKFHELYQSDVYLHLTRIRYFCCVWNIRRKSEEYLNNLNT